MTRSARTYGDESPIASDRGPGTQSGAAGTAHCDEWFLISERAIADQRAGKPPNLAAISSVQWHRVAYRKAYEAAKVGVDVTKSAPRMVKRASKRSDYSADAESDLAHYAAGERFVEGPDGGYSGRWAPDPDTTPELRELAFEMWQMVKRERRIGGRG